MDNLTEAFVTPYIPTIYTTPCTLEYVQKGKEISRDLFAERDSVVVIVFNITRDVLVLVKQFRAAAYVNDIPLQERESKIDVTKHGTSCSIALEWCAGIVDKNASLEQIAREEVLEELGYHVPLESLQRICSFPNGVYSTSALQTIFYCEVTDDMRVHQGGGIDDEIIEVVEMSAEEMKKYVENDDLCSPSNVLFGFYWFLENKCNDL